MCFNMSLLYQFNEPYGVSVKQTLITQSILEEH